MRLLIGFSLKNVNFLTKKDPSPVNPEIVIALYDWNTCYYSETALRDEYTVQCDTNPATPLTREFRISTNKGQTVWLREVEIYGHGMYSSLSLMYAFAHLLQLRSFQTSRKNLSNCCS